MKKFDLKTFHDNVQEDFNKAQSIVNLIDTHLTSKQYIYSEKKPPFDFEEEENSFNEARLSEILSSIRIKISFALEYMGLNRLLDEFDSEFQNHKPNLSEVEYIHYIDVFYSPCLSFLSNYFSAMLSSIEIDNISFNSSFLMLERILKGTPKMLSDRNIQPENEAQVRKEIYNMLIHVFPDTVREIPIAKISKIYKPDIGIKSLKSAIEYKFVNSETEMKTAIGGIFEDINGYEGSKDWTSFYAVFYMTDHFLTQHQIEEEFKLSKVSNAWKPIIIFGKGQRRSKINTLPKKENS